RWSKFNDWGASPDEMEQVQRLGSKSERDGANSTIGEQVQTRWSKFNVWGASPNEMEQIQRLGSKSERDGAIPLFSETVLSSFIRKYISQSPPVLHFHLKHATIYKVKMTEMFTW